jgi:type 1 glutamine amidotransferase
MKLYSRIGLIVLLLIAVTGTHASANKKNDKKKMHIVLLADEKDHGPAGNGLHDYPLWQERSQQLLNNKGGFNEVSTAWHWPSAEQFQTADVIVAYCYLKWTDKRLKQIKRYLKKGGGLVLIHSATWTKPEPSLKVAKVVGVGGFELFRHGTVKLDVVAQDHPICAGLPTTIILEDDEMYWPPTPVMENVTVLVSSVEDKGTRGSTPKAAQPAFWCYESGRGRVFGCVPGHSFHTFNNLAFRKLLLQGINWAADKQ